MNRDLRTKGEKKKPLTQAQRERALDGPPPPAVPPPSLPPPKRSKTDVAKIENTKDDEKTAMKTVDHKQKSPQEVIKTEKKHKQNKINTEKKTTPKHVKKGERKKFAKTDIDMLAMQLEKELSLNKELGHADRMLATTALKMARVEGSGTISDHSSNSFFAKQNDLMANTACWKRHHTQEELMSWLPDNDATDPQARIQHLRDREQERRKKLEQLRNQHHQPTNPVLAASQPCLSFTSSSSVSSSSLLDLKKWTSEDVKKWLASESNLKELADVADDVCGRDLYTALTERNPCRTLGFLFHVDLTDAIKKIQIDRLYDALCRRFSVVRHD